MAIVYAHVDVWMRGQRDERPKCMHVEVWMCNQSVGMWIHDQA